MLYNLFCALKKLKERRDIMYLYYTKEKDKVLVQNSNMSFDIFDNTNNIENILKVNNNIEFIEMKKKELHSMINEKTKEEIDIKLLYLDLLQEIQNKRTVISDYVSQVIIC